MVDVQFWRVQAAVCCCGPLVGRTASVATAVMCSAALMAAKTSRSAANLCRCCAVICALLRFVLLCLSSNSCRTITHSCSFSLSCYNVLRMCCLWLVVLVVSWSKCVCLYASALLSLWMNSCRASAEGSSIFSCVYFLAECLSRPW